jgi:hypothetical protein
VALYDMGECLRIVKKLCKQNGKRFEVFLSEIETNKNKIKSDTAANHIRIYKLCKDFPKYLLTTESLSFYINNHKNIRETLYYNFEHNFWPKIYKNRSHSYLINKIDLKVIIENIL